MIRSWHPLRPGPFGKHLSLFGFLGSIALVAAMLLALAFDACGTRPAGAAVPKLRWAYHVNFDSATGLNSLQAHMQQLDFLSPRWYLLDADANLSEAPDPNRAAIISMARANGVKLVPYVRNTAKYADLHRVMADPTLRARAVAEVTKVILKNDFDGVHFDLEDITASDGALLTQFMADMHASLHPKGKLVTQAIGPKTADGAVGFAGAHNYAELAKVNDFLVIMAYTSAGKVPHAPAAYTLVEDNARYAASRIPPAKILLGSAWYGFDYSRSDGSHADLRYSDVAQRITAHRPTVAWDPVSHTSYFTYLWAGARHDVWFEDARSVAEKLELVYKYDLAGAAGWRLGQEDPNVWEAFGAGLTGTGGTGTAPSPTPLPVVAPIDPTASPTPLPVAVPAGPAPILELPALNALRDGLGTTLSWSNPEGTAQHHLQVLPFKNDGPGIDLIRHAESSYTVPEPDFGRGSYVMLPDLTYAWRVRTSSSTGPIGREDPSWSLWSSFGTFRCFVEVRRSTPAGQRPPPPLPGVDAP